jgi:hypothetical protein
MKDARTLNGKMRVGVSLVKQLSSTFYSKTRMTFDELISNSRDSMATRVKIDISDAYITIEDDGDGMSPDELIKFFHISYTEKLEQFLQRRGRGTRKMIGKFGIGKLSLYQICRRFSISSVKDGIESSTEFDFDDLEKHKFIDEINLAVRSSPTSEKNGTMIRLEELKTVPNPLTLRRELSRSIPLDPDFRLFVNGIEVVKELLHGKEFPIDDEVKDDRGRSLGRVWGKFIYTDRPLKMSEFGIYVRVGGRVVNDNPRIIELINTFAANVAARRLFGDINADFLENSIQTNRSGFLIDDDKYVAFLKWLKSAVNANNLKYLNWFKQENRKAEKEYTLIQASRINRTPETSQRVAEAAETPPGKESIELGGKNYTLELLSLGPEAGEFFIDATKGSIIINDRHPMYLESRRADALDLHLKRTLAFAAAIAASRNLEEFQKKYEEFLRNLLEERFRM